MQRFDRQTKQYQYTTLSIQRKTNIKKKKRMDSLQCFKVLDQTIKQIFQNSRSFRLFIFHEINVLFVPWWQKNTPTYWFLMSFGKTQVFEIHML